MLLEPGLNNRISVGSSLHARLRKLFKKLADIAKLDDHLRWTMIDKSNMCPKDYQHVSEKHAIPNVAQPVRVLLSRQN